MKTNDILLYGSGDQLFRDTFWRYCAEMGSTVHDMEPIFREFEREKYPTFLRLTEEGRPVGFIQISLIRLSHPFFQQELGFIREFWVDSAFRKDGHGSALLQMAEEYFLKQGIYKVILTTDSAAGFYSHRGYVRDASIQAANHEDVFCKMLK